MGEKAGKVIVLKSAFRLVILACAGIGVFAACGGGSSTDSGSKTAAPTAKAVASGKVPADACALLTLDEIHTVGPDATAGTASPQQGAAGQTVVACRWEWTQGTGSLDLSVSTMPPGATSDMLKTSARAESQVKGHAVDGVGDFAFVWSPAGVDTKAQAVVNGLFIQLDLNMLGARDKQAAVDAWLKAVADRL